MEDGKVIGEVAPTPWRTSLKEIWSRTATVRFMRHRWQVRTRHIIDNLLGRAHADTRRYAVNIDMDRTLSYMAEIKVATDYLVGRMAQAAKETGASLLLVMDGDRRAIYDGIPDPRANILNAIASEAAVRHGVSFLDLYPEFAEDWARNKRSFEFQYDSHWNEYGHALVGGAVAKRLWPER
jgi:hypothetical protein